MGTRLAMAALGLYVVAVWGFVGFAVYQWMEEPAAAQMETVGRATATASTCAVHCTAFPKPLAEQASMVSRNDAARSNDLPL